MIPKLLLLLLLASLAHYTSAFSIPRVRFPSPANADAQHPLEDTLDAWIQREERVALDKLLANIAPGGRNVEGQDVVAGTVVASPSREGPDYWFQWVRDAAITMKTLVDIYADAPSSPLGNSISKILNAYTSLQHRIQRAPNPSGTFTDLSGLGEPKFQTTGAPFTHSWGRPQRDGPALRALTLMHYLRAYNTSHPSLWASGQAHAFFAPLYEASMPPTSVIKADLEYVSHFWNQTGFDLWEEVEGMHFFTLMVSARSLREGSVIARAFGDGGAAEWYALQAGYVENLLGRFWNARKGHLVETLWSKRSGLDCGLLLGALHGVSDEGDGDAVFPPWSDEVLVSLLALVRDQQDRFPINSSPWTSSPSSPPSDSSAAADDDPTDEPPLQGTALGRYPEDTYNGHSTSSTGNPWFLCTSSAAEILFRTATHISTSSLLTITPLSRPFYASLLSTSSLDVAPGTYAPSDALFHSVAERLVEVGDQFLGVVREHVDGEGGMSEQFDRRTGYMTGARDLTWSYGAFLQAGRARGVAKDNEL